MKSIKSAKYYIPTYYIKNFLISSIAIGCTTTFALFILEHSNTTYQYIGIAVAIFILIFGSISIGYYNKFSASQHKVQHCLYLHIFIVMLYILFDLIFSESSLFIIILRNFCYFLCLELGAYSYSHRLFKKSPKCI
jgi:hypothetical protein